MADTIEDDLLDRLKAIVGPKGWIADAEEMAPYLEEQRGMYHGATPLVVRPASTAEVADVVRACAETRTAIVPQGGNTGVCGGAVPNENGRELLISLSRLNAIRDIDPDNNTITAEAGCVLANIQAAAEAADRLFPLSLGAEGSCQIGGNLSTNAGGTSVLRYGNARELVLGLEVVLPDGRMWNGLRGLRKDNTGYDLKHVFIGAEGTLGIITAAVLKLFAKPQETTTALIGIRDVAAGVELLHLTRAACGDVTTAWELISRMAFGFALKHVPGTTDPLSELHDWYVLAELSRGRADSDLKDTFASVLAEAMEAGLVRDAVIAARAAQAEALWRPRESFVEAQKPEGASIKHDIAVPLSRIAAFVDEASAAVERAIPGARIVAVGHLGDGNVHFNVTQPVGADAHAFLDRREEINRLVNDIAVAMGGTVSAEHGVGLLRREQIRHYKSAVEIDLMRTLKTALDPDGIMNPGKVI